MWSKKDSWLSMVTPRLHVVADGEIWELSREITKSWHGYESPEIYRGSVLLCLVLADIHDEMFGRYAEILREIWVHEWGRVEGRSQRGWVECHQHANGMKTQLRTWLMERLDTSLSLVEHQWSVDDIRYDLLYEAAAWHKTYHWIIYDFQ